MSESDCLPNCEDCTDEFCEHECHDLLDFGDSEDNYAEFGGAILFGWGF